MTRDTAPEEENPLRMTLEAARRPPSIPRNVGLSWVSQFVYIAAQIARVAILYRIFEKQSRGTWFLMVSIAGFVVFLDFGFPNAFLRYFARGFGREAGANPAFLKVKNIAHFSFETLVGNAKVIVPLLSAATFAITFFGGLGYLHTVDTFPLFSGGITLAWLLMALAQGVSMLGNLYSPVLQGGGHVGLDALTKSSGSLFSIAFLVPALFFRASLTCVAFVEFTRAFLVLMFVRQLCLKYFPQYGALKPVFEKSTFKQLWKSGYPTFLGCIGSSLFNNTDALYIASLFQVAMLSDYYNTDRMIGQMYGFSNVIVASAFPTLLAVFGAGHTAGYRSLYKKILKYSVLFYGIFACYFVFFGSYLLQLWLGRGHFVGFPIFISLLLYYFFEMHNSIFMNVQLLVEKFPLVAALWAAAVFKLIFTFVLIRGFHLHLLGVIFGKFGAELATVTWFGAYFWSKTLDLRPLTWQKSAKALRVYCPLLLFLLLGYLTRVSPEAPVFRFAVQSACYFVFALAAGYGFMEKSTREYVNCRFGRFFRFREAGLSESQ